MKPSRRRFLKLASAAAAIARRAAYRSRRKAPFPTRPVHYHRRPGGRQLVRHHRAPDRPISVGKARPAIHHRDPARRRRQHRDRSVDARHADGYTLLLVNAQNTINAALYDKLNFDFLRDIMPVGGIDLVPLVMEVNPSLPAKTVPEFIAYAKANPGKLNMASAGIGGAAARRRRTVQIHDRCANDPCALSRHDAGDHRHDLRPGAGDVRRHADGVAADQGGQAAGARRDHGETPRRPARPADHRRFRAGLRSERLDRHRRAERHSGRNHRDAQQGDQRRGFRRHDSRNVWSISVRHRCLR